MGLNGIYTGVDKIVGGRYSLIFLAGSDKAQGDHNSQETERHQDFSVHVLFNFVDKFSDSTTRVSLPSHVLNPRNKKLNRILSRMSEHINIFDKYKDHVHG